MKVILNRYGVAIVGKQVLYCFDWFDTRAISYVKHNRFFYTYNY